MRARRYDEYATAEVAFYKKNPGLARVHLNLHPHISRKRVLEVFWTSLGTAVKAYPENLARNIFGGGKYTLEEIEAAARLGGALRRFALLMAKDGLEVSPHREWGVNSPRNGHIWSLEAALTATAYNADVVYYAFQRVVRWTGASYREALDAITVSRRPRRAAMIVRWRRKGIYAGSTWRSWRAKAWEFSTTPNRPLAKEEPDGSGPVIIQETEYYPGGRDSTRYHLEEVIESIPGFILWKTKGGRWVVTHEKGYSDSHWQSGLEFLQAVQSGEWKYTNTWSSRQP